MKRFQVNNDYVIVKTQNNYNKNAGRICLCHTTFALWRGVQVEYNIQRLSQLPGCGFALPVLAHRSDVHCLRMETAVEEFLWFQQDCKPSLQIHEKKNRVSCRDRHLNSECSKTWSQEFQFPIGGWELLLVFVLCYSIKESINRRSHAWQLTLDPQGKSFFQGVRFSVQTISRGRVA